MPYVLEQRSRPSGLYYKIVAATSLRAAGGIELQVNREVREGEWIPLGAPFKERDMWYQAMYRSRR